MSLIKRVAFPSPCIRESQHTVLLPFLYQTRTLLSSLQAEPRLLRSPLSHRRKQIHSISKASPGSGRDIQPGSNVRSHGNAQSQSAFVRWSPETRQPNKLEQKKIDWSLPAGGEYQIPERPQHTSRTQQQTPREPLLDERKQRNSTLTASEQAAFDQIFQEITKTSQKNDEEEEDLEEDDGFAEDGDVPGSPREQLAAIFEAAITKMNAAASLSDGGFDLNGQLDKEPYADAVKRLNLEPYKLGSDEEADVHLKRASEDHRRVVDSLLVAAKNDIEIWKILEKEVFSLMSQLNLQMKHEEKARARERKRRKKAAKTSDAETSKTSNPAIDTASIKITSATSKDNAVTKSKALNTTTLLYILQCNYAHHTLQALILFRTLKLSSSYALALLPRIKGLGPISYVLGASAPLYNELLFQKWTQFSDVQGLGELMQEMVNQGITPNLATFEFLRFVNRSRRRDLGGLNGAAKKSWWSLRPVSDGWTKVKSLYSRFREEAGDAASVEMDELRRERVRRLEEESDRRVPVKPGSVDGGRQRRVAVDFQLVRNLKIDRWDRERPYRTVGTSGQSSPPPSPSSRPSRLSSALRPLPDSNPSRASAAQQNYGEDEQRVLRRESPADGGFASQPLRKSSLHDWE